MAETLHVALLTSGSIGWSDIRSTLASIPGVSVIANVSTTDELLAVAARERLSAVIMPLRLGEESLLPLLPRLKSLQIVMLATRFEPSELTEAISHGTAGLFVLADIDTRDLAARLQSVILGGDVVMTASVAAMLRSELSTQPSVAGSYPTLSEREQLILQDLARGLKGGEIARRRGISLRTVRRTTDQLRLRFDVATTAELLVQATRAGHLP